MRSKLCHIVLYFFTLVPAIAQMKVEVITKTVEDQFDYKSGFAIVVDGKSATISIESWDKKEIGIEMKLISKGLTKENAEKELKYQKYVIDEINETYVIRNYLLLPNGLEKLSTIQETEIRMYIPQNINISIKNSFGNTLLKGVDGKVELESKYGELVLNDIIGTAQVNSTFGDLKMKNFKGLLTADLEHTATSIEGFSGNAYIKTNLGDMIWTDIHNIEKLKINAEKSDINLGFSNHNLASYYWQLKTKYGEIDFPEAGGEKKITYGNNQGAPIEITTDFGKIIIEE